MTEEQKADLRQRLANIKHTYHADLMTLREDCATAGHDWKPSQIADEKYCTVCGEWGHE